MIRKIYSSLEKSKIRKNEGVKYSELLHKFLEPFIHQIKGLESEEEIIEFGIFAWNTGNLKSLIPKHEFDKAINSNEFKGLERDLVKRMIDYKESHFKHFTNFIVEYEIEERNEESILSVITQDQMSYLEMMVKQDEIKNSQNDFSTNYINRRAIILKPKQPFIDWYARFDPDDLEELKETRTYLVSEEIRDLDEWLKNKFDKFFTFELESFHDNKKEWPQRRNYKMFQEWFHIDISIMIYDFENKPVSKSI
jgi:hypothetical protein